MKQRLAAVRPKFLGRVDENGGPVDKLLQSLLKVLARYPHIKRLIVVADRGLLSVDNIEELSQMTVGAGKPLEFILAVPGRRYGDFVELLQPLREKFAAAAGEVIDETNWQGHRLVVAHNPTRAQEQATLRRDRIAALQVRAAQLASFGKNGEVLGDDALPAILTAAWQADEENTGKSFPSYARMLQHHGKPEGASRYSWTVDFAARRAKAREEMQPLQDKAAGIKATVVDLKERLKHLKKDKADEKQIETFEVDIREQEKVARDLEAEAAAIDAAVFDLKAVNPNAVAVVDERTPDQIIENITTQGRIVAEALARLNQLMEAPEVHV